MTYHQGQMVPGYPAGMHPGYMQGSMVPHALARHNPGDHPSQNVRTAPTPSGDEPVTPSVDYPTHQQVPIPGPSANAAIHARGRKKTKIQKTKKSKASLYLHLQWFRKPLRNRKRQNLKWLMKLETHHLLPRRRHLLRRPS